MFSHTIFRNNKKLENNFMVRKYFPPNQTQPKLSKPENMRCSQNIVFDHSKLRIATNRYNIFYFMILLQFGALSQLNGLIIEPPHYLYFRR